MAKKNKTCLACKTKYSFCPSCSRADALAPSWRAQFCCEECMQLWTTLTRFNMGKHTKVEAKEVISGLNLKPIDTYVECVQRDMSIIMAEEPKQKRVRRSLLHEIVAPVEEAVQVKEEQVEETIHEVVETE